MSISTRSCYGLNNLKFPLIFFIFAPVPCFQCRNKPATIKCYTCRPSQGSDIEKLCYRCDAEIHSSDIGSHSHNKEFIPFTGKRENILFYLFPLEMKSNRAKDLPAGFTNSSLRFFETNDRKPKPNANNAKREIMQKINDLSEKFSGRTVYNTGEYQSKASKSENWAKNYAREKQKNEESSIKTQSAQTQTPLPKKDNKREGELHKEIAELHAELAKQKDTLEEKRRVHEEKVKKII